MQQQEKPSGRRLHELVANFMLYLDQVESALLFLLKWTILLSALAFFTFLAIAAIVFLAVVTIIFTSSSNNNADDHWSPQQPILHNLTDVLNEVPDRWSTHLSTDKPMYRRGETVFFRGLVLHSFTRTPRLHFNVSALAVISAALGPLEFITIIEQITSSTVAGSWQIPQRQAGGEYTLELRYPHVPEMTSAVRKFFIHPTLRTPRLNIFIEFLGRGYGPGDQAMLSVKVERVEGGRLAFAHIEISAIVDEVTIFKSDVSLDASGLAQVAFTLPEHIEFGDGSVNVKVEDGGTIESKSKTIPIVIKKVDVALFPEGGSIVCGLPNTIYWQARTPSDEPVDALMDLIELNTSTLIVRNINATHEGRGKFTFVPLCNSDTKGRYALVVRKPAGIKRPIDLHPFFGNWDLAISIANAIIQPEEQLSLTMSLAEHVLAYPTLEDLSPVNVTVTVYLKERPVAGLEIVCHRPTQGTFNISLPAHAFGVLRMAAFRNTVMVWERLVFRYPPSLADQRLQIDITANRHSFIPGDLVELNIRTSLKNGNHGTAVPVSAVVGLTVTDDAVLQTIDKRKQAPRLPAMAFLEDEVFSLEDAQAYLATNDQAALDLLLGTQGWRRFCYKHTEGFFNNWKEKADRVFGYGAYSMFPNYGHAFGKSNVARRSNKESLKVEYDEIGEDPQTLESHEYGSAMSLGFHILRYVYDQCWNPTGLEATHPEPELHDVRDLYRYSHSRRPRMKQERIDFTETVFWGAAIKTNEQGHALVTFDLSDSITTFRVLADAVVLSSASDVTLPVDQQQPPILGYTDKLLVSRVPFYIDSKVPHEVLEGDTLLVPINLVNDIPSGRMTEAISGGDKQSDSGLVVSIDAKAHHLLSISKYANVSNPDTLIPNGQRVRALVKVEAKAPGDAELKISAEATATGHNREDPQYEGPFADSLTRGVHIAPWGFPGSFSQSGVVSSADPAIIPVDLRNIRKFKSPKAVLRIYPTVTGNLLQALKALVREPYGCFEQTSAITYPMVIALRYFRRNPELDPALIQRTIEHLQSGYRRMVGYETSTGGFSWFGSSPGELDLTALGLKIFSELDGLIPGLVDPEVLQRTRTWLELQFNDALRKDHNPIPDGRMLFSIWHAWNAAPETLPFNRDKALSYAVTDRFGRIRMEEILAGPNSFDTALATLISVLAGHVKQASMLAGRLALMQQPDGRISVASGRWPYSEELTHTSLAALAWSSVAKQLRVTEPAGSDAHRFEGHASRAITWISTNCKDGAYGSTHATVLGLQAIMAHDDLTRPKETRCIRAQLSLDNELLANHLFLSSSPEAVSLDGLEKKLTSGSEHKLNLKLILDEDDVHVFGSQRNNGSQLAVTLPWTFHMQYHSDIKQNEPNAALHLETALLVSSLSEGDATQIRITMRSNSQNELDMTLIVLGIPAGLEVRMDQLKDMTTSGAIDHFEIDGNKVIFYWVSLAPHARIELRLDANAIVPGSFYAPASKAYIYYTPDECFWAPGLRVDIQPNK